LHFRCTINLILNFSPEDIFTVTEEKFDEIALAIFRYQAANVPVYRDYCRAVKCIPQDVHNWEDIPFLPISFFKTHSVLAEGLVAKEIFESSGTTGAVSSRHYVADALLYTQSFNTTFTSFYGSVQDYVVLALLPSYLERGNSSLVYMVDSLIKQSGRMESGFYLHNHHELYAQLQHLKNRNAKVLLIGVTYALLDFSEAYKLDFPELMVMETGGMKGRRKEMVREEVHAQLKAAFGVQQIHSEYGMTELLSQAYSSGDGLFKTSAWMKIVLRDLYDPRQLLIGAQTGAVNVIDLANVFSCSFIETGDVARVQNDGCFEIVGRADHAELRGCNLMVS